MAAVARMDAKEKYFVDLGVWFRRVNLRAPRAKAPELNAEPRAKRPRTAKQLLYQEQVKGAMAELRAKGLPASIGTAAALLKSKKAGA